MFRRKLILFGILFWPGAGYAGPATLAVNAPSSVFPAQVTNSTVTVNVGAASVLGAADFTRTFDTAVVKLNELAPLAAELQNNFFFNLNALSQGRVRVVVLNADSAVSPSGVVSLSSMTLTAVGVSGSSTTLNALVNLLVDTQTISYSPISVVPGTVVVGSSVTDRLPPRTQLFVSSPSFSQNPIFVSSQTLFGLTAVDDKSVVGDGQGLGVKDTQVSIDSGSFTVFTSSFNISSEGLHTAAWFSEDLAGNIEVTHSTSVFVDNTPPLTQLVFSAAPFIDVSSNVFISSVTSIAFIATDTASGVAFTQFQVDGGIFQNWSSSFTLAEGLHLITFRSRDHVGNLERNQSAKILVDATAPDTKLVVSSGTSISTSTVFSLSAQDPLSNGAASGVRQTSLALDSGAFGVYTSSFVIASSGTHTLQWYSQDHVGNTEVIRTTTVVVQGVDHLPPRTQLVTGSPSFGQNPVYVSSRTLFGFLAVDDKSAVGDRQGVGVKDTLVSIDSAPFTVYTASFRLAAPGLHTLQWFSEDLAGNVEITHSASVVVDITPPVTVAISSPAANANGWNNTDVKISLQAADNLGGSGVAQMQYTLSGAQNVSRKTVQGSSASITVSADGSTTVTYFATDHVGKTETAKTLTVHVDRTAPTISGMPPPDCTLWPPNHKLVQVAIIQSTDTLSGLTSLNVTGASNEPPNPQEPDIVLTGRGLGPRVVQLRADRLGSGTGRVYTLTATATDLAGNSVTVTGTCAVPHDHGSHSQGPPSNSVSSEPSNTSVSPNVFRVGVADPTFILRNVFVFPNPARGGAKPAAHVEVGIADQVTIKIYDVAGRELQEATLAAPSLINGQYAYEYVWDGTIPSGVYFYAVVAKKAGSADIKTRGKFAVVR
jgi:hypothetical protein